MKEMTYSKDIANAVNRFLTEDDWHFSFDKQRGLFKFNLNLGGRIKKINYIIDIRDDEYMVYAISPIGADENDEKMMAAMAEFVCRANYGLINGNFEFDMRDGEIRFKSFVDCDGMMPTTEIVRNSIYCPAAMFDCYNDGIIGIIVGNMSAREAIEKCEKSPIEEQLRELLRDDIDEDADMDTMITRLAEKMGIDTSESEAEGEQPSSTDAVTEVKTDLFGLNGGSI